MSAGWARCTARATPSSAATSRSRCCPRAFAQRSGAARALRARSAAARLAQPSEHRRDLRPRGSRRTSARWCWNWSRARRSPSAHRATDRLPIDEALAIARQIAEALEAAHETRHRPSRSEAGQHEDHARRRREGARLRPREGRRPATDAASDARASPTLTARHTATA